MYSYHRAPFCEGYKFCGWSKKGVRENYFHETTLVALFTMHMNLHTMEFPFIFGETNFMEVPKTFEIYKRRLTHAMFNASVFWCLNIICSIKWHLNRWYALDTKFSMTSLHTMGMQGIWYVFILFGMYFISLF